MCMCVVRPARVYPTTPLIKLGEKFSNIEAYLARVPHGIPNIIGLEHLTVAGDVIFGANVTLRVRGTVGCIWWSLWRMVALMTRWRVLAGHGDHRGERGLGDHDPGRHGAGGQGGDRQPAHPRPLVAAVGPASVECAQTVCGPVAPLPLPAWISLPRYALQHLICWREDVKACR